MTATEQPSPTATAFAKPLFCGEIHEDLVFPYPRVDPDERRKVDDLIGRLRAATADYDPRAVEDQGWLGDGLIADLGERGLLGLTVPEDAEWPTDTRVLVSADPPGRSRHAKVPTRARRRIR